MKCSLVLTMPGRVPDWHRLDPARRAMPWLESPRCSLSCCCSGRLKHLLAKPRSPEQARESGEKWHSWAQALNAAGHSMTGAQLEAGCACVTGSDKMVVDCDFRRRSRDGRLLRRVGLEAGGGGGAGQGMPGASKRRHGGSASHQWTLTERSCRTPGRSDQRSVS